jgi:hypothetical protein
VPPARLPERTFSKTQIALLFVVLAALAALPILGNPLPPLSDYVNHLARMHVIASGISDLEPATYYRIEWAVIPNLVMDVVVPQLAHVMNIYLAGQTFMILAFVLIMSGALALHRALYGRWSPAPLIAFPLVYNGVYIVGLMNYIFGIGVAIWAVTAWIALRERHYALRATVSALFVLVLFFCHLYVVGIYALSLLSFELLRLATRREGSLWRRLADFCATGVPFLPVIPLMLASPTWGLRGENHWEFAGKLDGLRFIVEFYSGRVAIALGIVVAIAAAFALWHRTLRLHPFGLLLALIGGLAYLAMPRVMFETYMADTRLPIAFAFLILACVQMEFRHAYARPAFAVMLVALLGVRVGEVQTEWSQLSRGTMEFRESVANLDRGAKVLVAYANASFGDDPRDLGLVHAACLAMIERSALVTTAFTVVGKQIMHVRDDFRDRVDTEDGTPPSIEQLRIDVSHSADEHEAYWRRWADHYDFLYVLFTRPGDPSPLPDNVRLVAEGGRFQLYRIQHDVTRRAERR